MTTNIRLFGLLILITIGCSSNDHYFINFGTDYTDHNGILFLTESANYQSLQSQKDTAQLKRYLGLDEFNAAFDTIVSITQFDTSVDFKTELVPWDTLFVKDSFVAELILLKDNSDNRGYYFQIRTYDKDHNLISAQDFATWADSKKKYCSGDYSKNNFTFITTCDKIKVKYKFDQHGHIILDN